VSGTVPCLCGHDVYDEVFRYQAPPAGEVRFNFSADAGYDRRILRCRACGHFVSVHAMTVGGLYAGEYVTSTYAAGIRPAFDRIVSLSPERSDNVGRVRRVTAFAHVRAEGAAPGTILDIGSGLCVFLHAMKAAGWQGTALDPDERAVEHARNVVGVDAVRGDFMTADGLGRFNIVSFNKVLEHVEDPVSMLARARRHVAPGGFVYIEVPDGEMAARDGPCREEFFVEHHHVFSAASLALMVAGAGFDLLVLERLQEPSSKYTLRAFVEPSRAGLAKPVTS
jgi:2-polyprenyl-3-methyl-5-hydroxy-6-metoxy-1,4-benzoquinol methylase